MRWKLPLASPRRKIVAEGRYRLEADIKNGIETIVEPCFLADNREETGGAYKYSSTDSINFGRVNLSVPLFLSLTIS